MAMNNERQVIELEQGWAILQKGITQVKNLMEGVPGQQITSEDYMRYYEAVYRMCTQKSPHDYSQQLYDRYRETFEDYITSTVLPALREETRGNHAEGGCEDNHKIMVQWLSRFFNYLDRYFIRKRQLPGLKEVGLMCFRDLVYAEMKTNVKDAVIALIDQERDGEQIISALLKNVLGIFVEIGMGNMYAYETDFETLMLQDTAAYYSRKAASWIKEYSYPDYMLKAEECLKREKERLGITCMPAVSRSCWSGLRNNFENLIPYYQIVQHELLTQYENQLLEKEHSRVPCLVER